MTLIQNFLSTEELAARAQRLAKLQERIDSDTAEVDAIKAEIRAGVPGPDRYSAGDLSLVVSTNNRFDARKAAAIVDQMPAEVRGIFLETTTTVKKDVLKSLRPDLYEQALAIGQLRVSLQ